MVEDPTLIPVRKRNALLAIGVGGLVAGTVDITQACIQEGWWDIPRVVAGGLLGRKALNGGLGTWILGVLLHFFIAFSWAAIYYVASRRLVFLREHWVICGLYWGVTIELVMNVIVLPLSALHATHPFTTAHDLLVGVVQKMIVVGLPIAFSVRRFAG
jgi:hypothetical protein